MNTKDVTPCCAYTTTNAPAVPVLLLNTDAPIEQRLALAAWMLQGLHASADMASTSLASDGELRAILGGMVPTIELIQSLVEV